MNKKVIFRLARHGQTEWNIEHRIQGQLDSSLTQEGKLQALQLALSCRSLNITKILTSPLGRAVETAEICAKELQLNIKKIIGFEERHFGCWQGKLTSEVKSHNDYTEITSQITDCKPELGESAVELLVRFETALKKELGRLDNIAESHCYLIIIHGDILRCFMASLMQQQDQQKKSMTGYDYKNGEIVSVLYDPISEVFSSL